MINTSFRLLAITSLSLLMLLSSSCLNSNQSHSAKAAEVQKKKKEKNKKVMYTSINCVGGTLSAKQTWQMPKELLEISGITWISKDLVAAVEDNMGNIFIYNLSTQKIDKKIAFGPKGDYEGIARVGEDYYVIRSDGQLFHISPTGKIIQQYKLPLTEIDNIETLHYDALQKRLIVGQKDGSKKATQKNFYSFNLVTKKFNNTPIFAITLNDPIVACGFTADQNHSKKKDKKKGMDVIRPSDLAIHPQTKEIYIADGPNQRILVLTSAAKPKHYLLVDKKEFPQVEGLMFSPQGQLFISSEGTKSPAKIARMEIAGQ